MCSKSEMFNLRTHWLTVFMSHPIDVYAHSSRVLFVSALTLDGTRNRGFADLRLAVRQKQWASQVKETV